MAGPKGDSWRILVDSLEQVQVLRDPISRRLFLELLEERIGAPLNVPEHSTTRVHLFAIVSACNRQHARGLVALRETLDDLEPGSMAVQRVGEIVEEMSALDLVREDERKDLLGLVSDCASEPLADLMRAAAGPAAAELPAEYDRPDEVIASLEQLNARPDGVPPLLVFVEYLARQMTEQLREQLREWSDQQAERMGIVDKVRAVRVDPQEPVLASRCTDLVAYLVIRIERDLYDPEHYSLVHWRNIDPNGWHPRRGEKFVGALDDVQRHVADLVAEAESSWAKNASAIRVDFMLPLDLLNLPVDQWDLEMDSGIPRLLGLHYQVVVRSLDRARTPRWHRAWRKRWGLLKDLMEQENADTADYWLFSEGSKQGNLVSLEAVLADRADAVSLVLRGQPTETKGGEVKVGLRSGVPVMIWHRSDAARSAFEQEVSAMREDLCDLPESARRLRSRAGQAPRPGSHVGSRVSVMWDDPERPVEPLEPPAAPNEEVPAS